MKYSTYLRVAIAAAIDAGRAIMDVYDDPIADFDVEMKADHSPLTRADKAAHQVIAEALAATPFPLLSEEGRAIAYDERMKWHTLWIVDPLDGTKEFIKRNGEFTVNIALVENGVPTLGVIYVPCRQALYYGAQGTGAYKVTLVDWLKSYSAEELHERAERLPLATPHEGLVVVASRSHQTQETIDFIEKLRKENLPLELISCGSSLKICAVAEGSADVYPRFAPTMEWDTAAGDAIARAAGCTVCQVDEKTPLNYNKEELLNPWFVVRRRPAEATG